MKPHPPLGVATTPPVSVQLRLHRTTDARAPGPASGEVWEVEPFPLADLSSALPAQVGAAPLAPDLGAIAADQPVIFELPLDLCVTAENVYIAVFPTNVDGVNGWNLDGAIFPALVIDYGK